MFRPDYAPHPAFAPSLSLRRTHFQSSLQSSLHSPSRRPSSSPPARLTRRSPRMIGPLPFPPSSSPLFRSEIVRAEAEKLESDHKALVALGTRYGSFDREGKVAYVSALEDCMDRWLIMLKRFQLDESFECASYVSQLKAELGKHGLTIDTLVSGAKGSLAQMRKEAEQTR